LTPVELTWEQDRRLAEFGLALTNLCARATRMATDLSKDEIAAGRNALIRKVRALKPRVLALVGVTLYRQVFPKGLAKGKDAGGCGPRPDRVVGAHVYVVPNPSGLNASYPTFDDKLVWFEKLRDYADGLAPAQAG
jgi:TDG/mug DNA glycosylase family protein